MDSRNFSRLSRCVFAWGQHLTVWKCKIMFAYGVLITVLTEDGFDILLCNLFWYFQNYVCDVIGISSASTPTPVQILSITYRFRQSIWQIIGWCIPLRMGHTLWDILDPPLVELTMCLGLPNCHLLRNGQANRSYTAKLVMSWTKKTPWNQCEHLWQWWIFAGYKL